MVFTWHLYVMVSLYIFAGIMHFIRPKMYLRVMPRYIPNPKLMVYLSGIAEIILGLMLCFPTLQTFAIYGIILMLIVFLAVHFYMLSGKKASAGIPKWILILRIPLQFVLMYWAYQYL
jgi:uncharacterized membrane protein